MYVLQTSPLLFLQCILTTEEANMPTNDTQTSLNDFCSKENFTHHSNNPLKASEFNWLFKNREHNGFAKAFVQINARKFLVHVPTFVLCLTERRGA
jgi:hypothetical protein